MKNLQAIRKFKIRTSKNIYEIILYLSGLMMSSEDVMSSVSPVTTYPEPFLFNRENQTRIFYYPHSEIL